MRNFITVLAVAGTVAGQAGAATLADVYSSYFAFGDSLSDNGNLGVAPAPPYYLNPEKGRSEFSNDKVFADVLDDGFVVGSTTQNYAFGGARATGASAVPGVSGQIGLFSLDIGGFDAPGAPFPGTPSPGARPLASVWFGGNDVIAATQSLAAGADFDAAQASVEAAAGIVVVGVAELWSIGFTDIAVLNVPDLGAVPLFNATPLAPQATRLARAFNAALGTGLDAFGLPGATVTQIDVFSILDGVRTGADTLGLSLDNVTDACLTPLSVCDPDRYLFWDAVHPTGIVHATLAGAVEDRLLADVTPVPLPAGLPLLGGTLALLAGLGAARGRRMR
ncbi:lipolytic protein G-D-S-L family [Oceaniovalibus guishaninsula JLT2003]|uniref:Lipolytic protein G-D-S-L family n=1 Tax=Oceaniovalibus guishaninsula JLT2003 TaxID=1231392 RepID=K2I5N8_9RHOB|nr:SGNH/GDSL hydrolase family protein [Oceaniovalibus guishaninsula]EKE44255.1 lipolytic protein G-D-S-L family [Oceaniovalibus guishaninsula JLT2003]